MSVSTVDTLDAENLAEPASAPASRDQFGTRPTVIAPRRRLSEFDLAELWKYRELLYFLVWRDIKVRYKQTALGVVWAVLQPLALMAVFVVFMGRLGEQLRDGVPYPLYLFAGLLPWSFFANAVTASGPSIVNSQNLVTKVYFPRLIIPLGAVAAGLLDFTICCGMQAVLMLSYRHIPGWSVLLVPMFMLGLTMAALGVGLMLSALTVAYRDFRHAVGFMIQIWMFATPAIYRDSSAGSGAWWEGIVLLNPVSGFVINIRAALLGTPFDIRSLAVSSAMSVALLIAGGAYFRRVERRFADII